MPVSTPPGFRGFYTTLRVEMTRVKGSTPVQTKKSFAKFVDAFKRAMNDSIRMNEEAMDRITLFEGNGALQYRRLFFIIEGEKEAYNKVLELFSTLPPETEIQDAIHKGKRLVENLVQDSKHAYTNSRENNAPSDELVNIKNVQIGYKLTEDCMLRAGRSTF